MATLLLLCALLLIDVIYPQSSFFQPVTLTPADSAFNGIYIDDGSTPSTTNVRQFGRELNITNDNKWIFHPQFIRGFTMGLIIIPADYWDNAQHSDGISSTISITISGSGTPFGGIIFSFSSEIKQTDEPTFWSFLLDLQNNMPNKVSPACGTLTSPEWLHYDDIVTIMDYTGPECQPLSTCQRWDRATYGQGWNNLTEPTQGFNNDWDIEFEISYLSSPPRIIFSYTNNGQDPQECVYRTEKATEEIEMYITADPWEQEWYINQFTVGYSKDTNEPTQSPTQPSTSPTIAPSQNPTTINPTTSNPTTSTPTTSIPTTSKPTTPSPTTTKPTTSAPTTANPTAANPTTTNPTTPKPTTTEPTESPFQHPTIPLTPAPTTPAPTTLTPTESKVSTILPTTIEPTTIEPTTAEPNHKPAPTNFPTTANPTTSYPSTSSPSYAITTKIPTTKEPTTSFPTSSTSTAMASTLTTTDFDTSMASMLTLETTDTTTFTTLDTTNKYVNKTMDTTNTTNDYVITEENDIESAEASEVIDLESNEIFALIVVLASIIVILFIIISVIRRIKRKRKNTTDDHPSNFELRVNGNEPPIKQLKAYHVPDKSPISLEHEVNGVNGHHLPNYPSGLLGSSTDDSLEGPSATPGSGHNHIKSIDVENIGFNDNNEIIVTSPRKETDGGKRSPTPHGGDIMKSVDIDVLDENGNILEDGILIEMPNVFMQTNGAVINGEHISVPVDYDDGDYDEIDVNGEHKSIEPDANLDIMKSVDVELLDDDGNIAPDLDENDGELMTGDLRKGGLEKLKVGKSLKKMNSKAEGYGNDLQNETEGGDLDL